MTRLHGIALSALLLFSVGAAAGCAEDGLDEGQVAAPVAGDDDPVADDEAAAHEKLRKIRCCRVHRFFGNTEEVRCYQMKRTKFIAKSLCQNTALATPGIPAWWDLDVGRCNEFPECQTMTEMPDDPTDTGEDDE